MPDAASPPQSIKRRDGESVRVNGVTITVRIPRGKNRGRRVWLDIVPDELRVERIKAAVDVAAVPNA